MTGILNVLLASAPAGDRLVLGAVTSGANTGYTSGTNGTLTPSTLSDGNAVVIMQDEVTLSVRRLKITGFGGINPGQGYIKSFAADGTTLLGASATYAWDGLSSGTWDWPLPVSQFQNGVNYVTYVSHG